MERKDEEVEEDKELRGEVFGRVFYVDFGIIGREVSF